MLFPLEEVSSNLDKKIYGKIVEEKEINEMGEELSIVEFDSNLVNNLIMNLKEFGESSRKNAHFMRRIYIST